jgi:hypothetical protein
MTDPTGKKMAHMDFAPPVKLAAAFGATAVWRGNFALAAGAAPPPGASGATSIPGSPPAIPVNSVLLWTRRPLTAVDEGRLVVGGRGRGPEHLAASAPVTSG